MINQTNLQNLVGRIVEDETFAKQLLANPEQQLNAIGVDATPEILDALKGLDLQAVRALGDAFGKEREAAW